MEADMQAFGQALELEDGTAAGVRQRLDDRRDLGLYPCPRQRGHDNAALGRDIGVMRHMLADAAAAEREVGAYDHVRGASRSGQSHAQNGED